MVTINKSAHTKKSGNLFNDPRIIFLHSQVDFIIFHYSFTRRDLMVSNIAIQQ